MPTDRSSIAHTNTSALLRLDRVSLTTRISERALLKDLSIEIFPQERIVLTGPSGAGKTLFLRLLNRLSEPSSGIIYLRSQDLRQIPPLQVRQQITLVPQESKLLGMTVERAIAYPLELRGIKPAEIQQRLDYWCDRLHLPKDWRSRTEAQLSVGQRQLVALTRALAIQPDILLLDEPTSALDRGRSMHVLNVLSQLPQTHDLAIVTVSHQLDLVQDFATRVLYLQDGELRHDFPADQADWMKLKTLLVDAEAKAAAEWD
jgi:D-methionine transport system ATP-binding protein